MDLLTRNPERPVVNVVRFTLMLLFVILVSEILVEMIWDHSVANLTDTLHGFIEWPTAWRRPLIALIFGILMEFLLRLFRRH